jgi:hypothetical protein
MKQKRFLEDCLKSQRVFADVMGDHGVTHQILVRWLSLKNFRYHVRRVQRALRKQREMDLEMGATRGAELLHRTAQLEKQGQDMSEVRMTQCRAAEALVKLARVMKGGKRTGKSREGKEPERLLSHPDHSEEEVLRLMDLLEGKEGKDSRIDEEEEPSPLPFRLAISAKE